MLQLHIHTREMHQEKKKCNNFINKIKGRSIYDFGVEVGVDDNILTLSTCHGESKKLVVQAKLIKKEIKNP